VSSLNCSSKERNAKRPPASEGFWKGEDFPHAAT